MWLQEVRDQIKREMDNQTGELHTNDIATPKPTDVLLLSACILSSGVLLDSG